MKCPTLGMMAMNSNADVKSLRHADDLLKRGFASMLKGGVIMDVVTPEQSAVAEDAEVRSVVGLEEVNCSFPYCLRLVHYEKEFFEIRS